MKISTYKSFNSLVNDFIKSAGEHEYYEMYDIRTFFEVKMPYLHLDTERYNDNIEMSVDFIIKGTDLMICPSIPITSTEVDCDEGDEPEVEHGALLGVFQDIFDTLPDTIQEIKKLVSKSMWKKIDYDSLRLDWRLGHTATTQVSDSISPEVTSSARTFIDSAVTAQLHYPNSGDTTTIF